MVFTTVIPKIQKKSLFLGNDMRKHTYEIWVLGYNEDDTVNDYEWLICGLIENQRYALELFNFSQTWVEKPKDTPKAKLVLEEVEYNNNGDSSCVNVLAETEL